MSGIYVHQIIPQNVARLVRSGSIETMLLNATSKHSNNQLAARVWNSMQRLGFRRLARVKCESRGTTIVLQGATSSYYQKQLAQTIAAKVPGVHHVINQLQVIDVRPMI